MGQLQWNDVAIPQFSTGDMTRAGQTITGAFDRFAQLLDAQEARKREEAANRFGTQIFATQDEAGLAALGQQLAGTSDRRLLASGMKLGQLLTGQRSTLLQQEGQRLENWNRNDEKLTKEALVANSGQLEKLGQAYYHGNPKERDAARDQLLQLPGGDRVLSAKLDWLTGRSDTGIDDRREDSKFQWSKYVDGRQLAQGDARLAIERAQESRAASRDAFERAQITGASAIPGLAAQIARQAVSLPEGDRAAFISQQAVALATTPGKNGGIPANKLDDVIKLAGSLAPSFAKPIGANVTRGNYLPTISVLSDINRSVNGALEGRKVAVEAKQPYPLGRQALGLVGNYKPQDLTTNAVAKAYDDTHAVLFPEGNIEALQRDYPNIADIRAAIDVAGNRGWKIGDANVREVLKEMAAARALGTTGVDTAVKGDKQYANLNNLARRLAYLDSKANAEAANSADSNVSEATRLEIKKIQDEFLAAQKAMGIGPPAAARTQGGYPVPSLFGHTSY